MLAVQLFSEPDDFAQVPLPPGVAPSHVVVIRESRPGELQEPRYLIRRAIAVVKVGKASRRKAGPMAHKVLALILSAATQAQALGRRWSIGGTYDPLPDFLELRQLLVRRLHPTSAEQPLVTDLLAALDQCIHEFKSVSAEQRMGVA